MSVSFTGYSYHLDVMLCWEGLFFFLNQHSEGMEKMVIDVKKGTVTEHGACHFPEYVFRTGQRVASMGVLT